MPSVLWTVQSEKDYEELKDTYDMIIFENFTPKK